MGSIRSSEGSARVWLLGLLGLLAIAGVTVLLLALLTNIFERKQEARQPFIRLVEVTEDTMDPKVWGQNWPFQYDSYLRTSLPTTTKYGGVESFVWDLARELAGRGHEVTIVGGVGPRREPAPGVRVLTFPFVSRGFWQSVPPLRRAYAMPGMREGSRAREGISTAGRAAV